MNRALRLALAFPVLLLAAGAVQAQDAPASRGTLPAGDGSLRGRVVDDASGVPAANMEVLTYTVLEDGTPGIATLRTGADGRFAIDGVDSDPQRIYLVGTRAGDVPLGERVSFRAGENTVEVELRMAQPTDDTRAIRLGAAYLRIDRGCERLRINEAHEIENPSDTVVFVPEGQREGRRPVLEAQLPAEATDVLTVVGASSLGFEVEGTRVRFWGPVYPGSQDLEFGYSLPGEPGARRFERGFPAGATRVALFSDAEGSPVSGEGLRPSEGRVLQGRPHTAVEARGVEPGGVVAFTVEVPAREDDAARLSRTEVWLELDDAALVVDENHLLEVEGGGPLGARSDAPLLCLALPDGAEALRFSGDTLRMGVELDPSGALAFRGPLPDESVVSIRYRLPVSDARGAIAFERRFPSELELLSVFVADNRVIPETSRLHRKRSVRRSDRSYLHLEGFQIAAGEEVAIRLRRIGAPRSLPRMASIGFALLAAGGALAFLIAPIGGARADEADAGESRRQRLAAERDAVYASIRDLDEDFETGKLTPEDHAELRDELRAQAARLLEAERQPEQEARKAEAAEARSCTRCGEKLPPRARFCPGCGEQVTTGAGA